MRSTRTAWASCIPRPASACSSRLLCRRIWSSSGLAPDLLLAALADDDPTALVGRGAPELHQRVHAQDDALPRRREMPSRGQYAGLVPRPAHVGDEALVQDALVVLVDGPEARLALARYQRDLVRHVLAQPHLLDRRDQTIGVAMLEVRVGADRLDADQRDRI